MACGYSLCNAGHFEPLDSNIITINKLYMNFWKISCLSKFSGLQTSESSKSRVHFHMISQCFHTNQYPFHITSTCYTEGLHVSYMEVVPHTATSMHFPMLPHSFRMFHATSTCRVEYSAMGRSQTLVSIIDSACQYKVIVKSFLCPRQAKTSFPNSFLGANKYPNPY